MIGFQTNDQGRLVENAVRINRPVRVLAVIDGYRLTGPARQLLAAGGHRDGWHARITLALFQRGKAPSPLITAAKHRDLPVIVVPDRFPGDPRSVRSLVTLTRGPEIDVLQTHGYKANVLARLLIARVKKPWVAFLHGDTWENWKVRAYFALERSAIRRADRIVVVSNAMAERVATWGVQPTKIRVVRNACLLDASPEIPRAWHVDAPPVVGVVGRLSPEKGVDVAIRAHAAVMRRRPEARLLIAGEGPEQSSLTTLAGHLGVSSSVQWLGYHEDLRPVYRDLTVLLIPSRSEGMPNVALEAMAQGLPVVATAVGGIPEIVADGHNGFLAQSEDVRGLSDRIVQLFDDPGLRRGLGEHARRDVRTRFSLDARVKALTAVYRETLEACTRW